MKLSLLLRLLLSFALFTTAAFADPISAAIVGATIFGSTTAAAVATFIITTALEIGATLAVTKIAGLFEHKPERQAQALTLQLGEADRQLVVGPAVVGGSLSDAFNYGGSYGTDWEVQRISLADHRVPLLGFYVNNQFVPYTGDGVVPDVAGRYTFNGQLEVHFRDGAMDQAPPVALAGQGGYTAADNAAGVSEVWVAYKADAAGAKNPIWPGGRPQFKWLLGTPSFYDPRKDSTVVGGSGAHRWDDPSTWEPSRNPIIVRHNWARGIYAGGLVDQPEMLLLGRGLSAVEAPPARIIAWANICDEQVPQKYLNAAIVQDANAGDHSIIVYAADGIRPGIVLTLSRGLNNEENIAVGAGGMFGPVTGAPGVYTIALAAGLAFGHPHGEQADWQSDPDHPAMRPRYAMAGVFNSSEDFNTQEGYFAAACAGRLIQPEGGIEVEPGHAKSPVFSITDDDLVAGAAVSWLDFGSRSTRVNSVIPSYVEPAQMWASHAAPIRRSLDDIAADGGPKERNLALPHVTLLSQAQELGEIDRLSVRYERTCTVTLPPEFSGIEEGDWGVYASKRRAAGNALTWEVISQSVDEKRRITVALRETSGDIFDRDGLTDELPPTGGNLPSATPPDALIPQDFTVGSYIETGPGGTQTARLQVTWTNPADSGALGTVFQVRVLGDTVAATVAGPTPEDALANAFPLLARATQYEIRMAFQVAPGRGWAWTDWATVTMPDVKIVSADIADGAVTSTKFAAGIAPVGVVSSLPVSATEGDVVVLTTDGQLYRWHSGAWTLAVPAINITGQVADAQIAALAASKITGTIINSQIAAGAVTASNFASGIRPVQVVSSLPGSASAGDTAFLTTDGKLYRYYSGDWTAAVLAADVGNGLTATQISSVNAAAVGAGLTAAQISSVAAATITGTIVNAQIAAGAVTASNFASGIRPVQVVSSLPGSASAGDTAFLTTDGKLYRYYSGAWTAAVLAADVGNGLTATQIASVAAAVITGTLVTSQIGSGQVTATQIASATITATQLASGAVGATQLASAAVTAAKTSLAAIDSSTGNLTANSVSATQIVANSITAAKIAANTITASEIAAGAIGTTALAAGAVTAAKITAGTITTTEIASGTIVAGNIAASTITGAKIAATTITASNIAANTITAGQIAAGTITATQLAANSVSASKVYIGDSSNIITDSDCFDTAYWNNMGTAPAAFSSQPGPYGSSKNYFAYSVAYVADTYCASPDITCVPGDTYFVSGTVNDDAPQSTKHIGLWFWNASGTLFATSYVGSTAGAGTLSGAIQIPVGAAWMRYICLRIANASTGQAYFGAPVLRRMYTGALIVNGTITAANIAAATITTTQIAAGTIVAGNIAAATITGAKIAGTTVTASNLVAGTITANEIAASTITGAKIAATTITAANIAGNTITASQLAANTITAGQIAAGAIGTTQLSANAVTASKVFIGSTDNLILDGQCSDASAWAVSGLGTPTVIAAPSGWGSQNAIRCATGVATSYLVSRGFAVEAGRSYFISVTLGADNSGGGHSLSASARFYDISGTVLQYSGIGAISVGGVLAVSTTAIAPSGAVSADFYLQQDAGMLANIYLAAPVVRLMAQGNLVVDGTITAAKIAATSITAAQIASATITGAKIAATTITASNIVSSTITATQIAAGTITSNELAANSIIAGKIATGAINATAIIVDNIIVTGKLVANAVTDSSVATGANTTLGTGFTDILTITKTTSGGPLLIQFNDYCTWTGSGPTLNYQVTRDGSPVCFSTSGGGTCPDNLHIGGIGLDTGASAASHTFKLQGKYIGSNAQSRQPALVITELKK